ncbi:hypothetical protein LOK49_LG15G01860 [Camellia lanceoleosa]|uniref:Uncharacterized protein n=1 Tax=Camellia lanceoleosa TaxID=1840588 RepID=A0ACC0F4I3_9ERIC|nr:hypothetical protein LOK49_LG15G01860 [Camellia lanceoleosa]
MRIDEVMGAQRKMVTECGKERMGIDEGPLEKQPFRMEQCCRGDDLNSVALAAQHLSESHDHCVAKGSTGLKPYGLGMDNAKGLLLRHHGWNFWESSIAWIKDKIVRTGAAVNTWNWRTLGHVQKQIKNKLDALWYVTIRDAVYI